MTEITLQAVRAKQTELEKMIAALMAEGATSIAIDEVEIDLRPGEHYAGLVLNEDGTVKHHLVLMADVPDDKLSWKDAMAWAEALGGSVPTRQEASLIFANCRPHVEAVWHWTSEAYDNNESYAWYCDFYDGYQLNFDKSYEGSARAVRRLNP